MGKIINKALLVQNIKQSSLFSLFLFGIYFVSFINLNAFIVENIERNTTWFSLRMVVEFFLHRDTILIMSNGFPVLMIAVWLNLHLFFSKKANFIYTLPITKQQLFATNFLSGAILLLVPLLLFWGLLLTLPPVYNNPQYRNLMFFAYEIFFAEYFGRVNTFTNVSIFIGQLAIGNLFYLAMVTFSIMIAGNVIVAIMLTGLFVLGPVTMLSIFDLFAQRYIFGYFTGQLPFSHVFAFNNPVGLAFHTTQWYRNMYLLIYVVFGIIFFVIANYLHNKRKLELTDDSIVFYPTKVICIWLFSFFGMVAGSIILTIITRNTNLIPAGYILGWAVFYIIANWISNKSFAWNIRLKPSLIHAGISITLYFTITIIFRSPIVSYNVVPHRDNVVAIQVGHPLWGNTFIDRSVRNPELIDLALELNQVILDNRSYLRQFENRLNSYFDFIERHETIFLTYIHPNGSQETRQYILPLDFLIEHSFDRLLLAPEIAFQDVPSLFNPQSIGSIHIEIWEWDQNRSNMILSQSITGELVESLAPIIIEEFIEHRRNLFFTEKFLNENQYSINLNILIPEHAYSSLTAPYASFVYNRQWLHLNSLPGSRLMNWVQENFQ